jgi:aminoglycoside/choline kinase family phosphotransferase
MTRAEAIEAFLAAAGFAAAARQPLARDASFRVYSRLAGGPRPAVLMDAPSPEDIRPWLLVARELGRRGVRVPAVLAADAAAGLLLMEDFGDATYAALIDGGHDPVPLFARAGRVLAGLHRLPPPESLPRWDAEAMARAAAATLLDWWWPAAFGEPCPPAARAAFTAAVIAMLAAFAGDPPVLVHRDFFAANLMRVREPDGSDSCGVIDFQDAAIGHPAYDAASLAEDARRDIPDAARAALLAELPHVSAAALAAHAALRHARVAGLWVRLDRRDGKPAYLRHGPRTWALLGRALAHPAALPLRAWFDAHVPAALRANPRPAQAA